MGTVQTSSFICPTLIGRAEQVALLTELMTLAGRGQSRLALIAGKAGVGKSRLVAELYCGCFENRTLRGFYLYKRLRFSNRARYKSQRQPAGRSYFGGTLL